MQTNAVKATGAAGFATVEAAAVARPATTSLARPQGEAPSAEHIKQAVMDANKVMDAIDPSLQFEVDPETNITVIKVIDTDGKTVLRQVPGPEMIEIAQSLGRLQGLLLKQEA